MEENKNELWRTKSIDSVEEVDVASLTMADLRVFSQTACSAAKGFGAERQVIMRSGYACPIGNVEAGVWNKLAEEVVVRQLGEEAIIKAMETVRQDPDVAASVRRDAAKTKEEALRRCVES